jgi:CRP-like cAMP-binding protein
MDEQQEEIFVEHLMPHGITPKQFERIEASAEVTTVKKGEALIRKGEKLDHVYLVVHGSTQAHILGRHLTAQSTNAKTKGAQKLGGDSGAWVGEMAFLDRCWEKEQGKIAAKRAKKAVEKGASKSSEKKNQEKEIAAIAKTPASPPATAAAKKSIVLYTILAKEDCLVWKWSFEDMESLVSSSPVRLLINAVTCPMKYYNAKSILPFDPRICVARLLGQ